MGIKVFTPYNQDVLYERGREQRMQCIFGNFKVSAFALTDLNGRFTHTNTDGSECPCYGFYITHPDMGKMVYITDTEFVKWRFTGINHILISCNYMKKYLSDDEAKRNHVLRGHMELDTVKDFVKANKSNALRNVILCHLSGECIDPAKAKEEVEKVSNCPVYVAKKGLEIELSLFPF